ncbi:MAG: hypothetical protein LBB65_03625 [Burkholderiales bacterium]|nr:hypothetical protein [Burkholderiales bacterium]
MRNLHAQERVTEGGRPDTLRLEGVACSGAPSPSNDKPGGKLKGRLKKRDSLPTKALDAAENRYNRLLERMGKDSGFRGEMLFQTL